MTILIKFYLSWYSRWDLLQSTYIFGIVGTLPVTHQRHKNNIIKYIFTHPDNTQMAQPEYINGNPLCTQFK